MQSGREGLVCELAERRLLEVAVRGCAVGKKFVTRYKYGSVMDVNL